MAIDLAPKIIGQNYTNKYIILKDGKKNIYQRRETLKYALQDLAKRINQCADGI